MVRKHIANLFKLADSWRKDKKLLKKSNKITKTTRKVKSLIRTTENK